MRVRPSRNHMWEAPMMMISNHWLQSSSWGCWWWWGWCRLTQPSRNLNSTCGRLPCPLARNLPPRTKVSNLTRGEFANVFCTCANLTHKEFTDVKFAKRLTLSRLPLFLNVTWKSVPCDIFGNKWEWRMFYLFWTNCQFLCCLQKNACCHNATMYYHGIICPVFKTFASAPSSPAVVNPFISWRSGPKRGAAAFTTFTRSQDICTERKTKFRSFTRNSLHMR